MKNIILILFCALQLISGDKKLSGNLKVDLLSRFESDSVEINFKEKKNPIFTGMQSFAIPGLGQYKTDRITEAIIFSAVEVATISTMYYLNSLGDKKTLDYKNYADKNWSVVKYAEWINIFGAEFGDSTKIYINPNTNLQPWERISWSDLSKWEHSRHEKGGFTHQLPLHGEQQYFELIGKYYQYKFGWKDYVYSGNALTADDIPSQVTFYMDERAKANQFYYKLKIATGVLFLNHLISAIDATVGAKNYNEKMKLNLSISSEEVYGQKNYYPTLNFKYTF